ncbi:LysM peptidoglycan-binding domain-containing protein [Bacillus benzoevorans]|uniref:LysM repeat protein n=1 Tax=Bacillus benzoevorans TaxID=1456 RepID=A0A7X0HNU7_9BACI|nr:LysM peptidoglycan-binding domain-containing protein [Bacillus benzoevorans]MBB6444225.1 LysM repeat protein [Bacillus benzoevorans]
MPRFFKGNFSSKLEKNRVQIRRVEFDENGVMAVPVIFREYYIYTVYPGDTLYSIAQKFNSSAGEIMRVNHIFPPVTDPGLIFPGDVLLVPNLVKTGKVHYIVHTGDALNKISYTYSTYIDLVSGINHLGNPNMLFPSQRLVIPAFIYEVKTGDSLNAIASRYGLPLSSIVRANERRPGFQADVIWPGYHLIIPLPTMRNMVVWTPLPGTTVGRGFKITGQARSFEANVLHQLKDANGITISNERFTTADIGAPEYGNFTSMVPFDRSPTSNRGELWVYTRSAKDGSMQDLVRMRVYF